MASNSTSQISATSACFANAMMAVFMAVTESGTLDCGVEDSVGQAAGENDSLAGMEELVEAGRVLVDVTSDLRRFGALRAVTVGRTAFFRIFAYGFDGLTALAGWFEATDNSLSMGSEAKRF